MSRIHDPRKCFADLLTLHLLIIPLNLFAKVIPKVSFFCQFEGQYRAVTLMHPILQHVIFGKHFFLRPQMNLRLILVEKQRTQLNNCFVIFAILRAFTPHLLFVKLIAISIKSIQFYL